jgi:hypothetical protein
MNEEDRGTGQHEKLVQMLALYRRELAQLRGMQETWMEQASKLPKMQAERDEFAASLARQLSVAYWRQNGPAAYAAKRTLRSRIGRLLRGGRPSGYEAALGLQWDHVRLIESSRLFDGGWYLREYPDVVAAGANPAEHFLLHGADEGRNPGPGFDTTFYLRAYPDVAQSRANPLVHYLLFGAHEGRLTMPTSPA